MKRMLLSLICVFFATQTFAQPAATKLPPSIFEGKAVPSDKRLGEMKTLNGHFPFKVPENPKEWKARAEQLKQRVLIANGLWPMPNKTPLQSVIHGKVQRDGFTVEKVYFQSLPGHFVTGLLFRPDQPSETPRPGVLSPHGHGGRQQKHSEEEIERQVSIGAEHFVESGSMPKLARCAQLARMGCVTFIFDMLGYADSIQISRPVAHRHADPRPEETGDGNSDGWVFYSVAADLRLQSIMGLQTWNAVRALDFLESLPDVDPDRLAVTGGSGGGTQSILLGAIDDRIKVSFPNGMVSTSMQGGCYCENCNYLRVGTGNVELAALFAPRPQAMTAADDWTKDMMKDGYPELRRLYAMLGNEADVYCRPMLHFKHNYNYVMRATMYQWMNRHMKLGLDDPIIEQDFELLSEAEAAVWNDQHPAPKSVGPSHEKDVCKWFDEQALVHLNDQPQTGNQFLNLVHLSTGAFPILYGADDIQRDDDDDELQIDTLKHVVVGETSRGDLFIGKGKLTDSSTGAELPLLTVQSPTSNQTNHVVVWTDGDGKNAAFDADGNPSEMLKKLAASATVLLPDLLGQGEFTSNQKAVTEQRLIDDKRTYSAFTFGYNPTLLAQRVRDLLSVLWYAKQKPQAKVSLVATSGAAPWAAPASVFGSNQIHRALIDTQGFRFANVKSYRDANFVPGAVKYGDLPMLLALAADDLLVAGESDESVQKISSFRTELSFDPVSTIDSASSPKAIEWLLE